MALNVQNVNGSVANANAYITLAEFKAYHDDRGNDYSAYIDAKLNGAIIRATDFLDTRFSFRGVKLNIGVKAADVLTTTGNFSLGDAVTIDGVVYTFASSASQPYGVLLGGGVATSLANLVKAINNTGTPGIEYGAGTLPNAAVAATSDATTLTITASIGGVAGNDVAASETSSQASWASATLTGGTDQTTEFPRKAGADVFIPFFDTMFLTPVADLNLLDGTFVALVGPDGANIIGIPPALKRACAEYAFRALSEPLFQDAPAPEGGRLIDEHTVKVDVIEETIKYAASQSGGFAMPAYPAADLLLTRAGLILSGRVLTR